MASLIRRALERIGLSAPPLAPLTPIAQRNASDVFVCGYPKSGNTWFQYLLAGVIYGVDASVAPDALVQELIPDLHEKRQYRRYGTPTFFKSHHLPRPEYRRVVFLLRDGRDVMVSYFHHRSALAGREDDFLRLVRTSEAFGGKWSDHTEAWLKNPYGAEIITIRYEDLAADAATQLDRLCRFAGVERDRAFLERVVLNCRFDRMQARESRLGWENSRWPKDKAFVRRGEVGSYKDEMPAAVLDAFMEQAGATLRKCNYAA